MKRILLMLVILIIIAGCDIDGNNISHSIKYTKLQRLYSTNVMEVEAIPLINEL